jgi:hypothetical protein
MGNHPYRLQKSQQVMNTSGNEIRAESNYEMPHPIRLRRCEFRLLAPSECPAKWRVVKS